MDYADFGRYLTQQRELRGLGLDEVARKTRIPESRLTALETGKVEALPDRVFVLAYIRAYAKSARPFNWKYTDFRHRMVKK